MKLKAGWTWPYKKSNNAIINPADGGNTRKRQRNLKSRLIDCMEWVQLGFKREKTVQY